MIDRNPEGDPRGTMTIMEGDGLDVEPPTSRLRFDWWEPIGDGALQTTPSELVRWADNFRKPRFGGPKLLAAQLNNSVEIFPGGPRYGAGLFVVGNGQIGHGGDWLGFESSFQVSADHTRSMTVSCNSWAIDINTVAGQINAIWVNPPA